MGDTDKIGRVLDLSKSLSKRWYTKKELAEIYGVHERTIHRDLQTLELQGYKLEEERVPSGLEKRYRLPREKPISALQLNPDETYLLVYCLALAEREALPRDREKLRSLWEKVTDLFPDELA